MNQAGLILNTLNKTSNLLRPLKLKRWFLNKLDTHKRLLMYTALASGTFIFIFWAQIKSPGAGSYKTDFLIDPGTPTIRVIHNLHKQGLIQNKFFFRALIMLKRKSRDIQHGLFSLHDGMSSHEIIDILTSGKTKTTQITIPEGFHNRQIANLLVKNHFFNSYQDFLHYANDPVILKKYQIPVDSIEGYIFPDTYHIPIGYPKKKIIEYFLNHFLNQVKSIPDFPTNPIKRHELITFASIVEREAKLKEEIEMIAGVFQNRLKANYPLESCATIQYLFDKPRKRLFFRDLKIRSPYNTYIHKGLPPGPIASPGLEVIKASLNPKKTDYMFFVVRGDGGHVFSRTLGEHNRAFKQYMASWLK